MFFTQIALGDTITIPGLRGELELKIPSSTRDKEQIVFKGEGVSNVNGYGKGNFVAQIKIQYPDNVNTEQREILEKLQESFGIESKPHEDVFDGMFSKVKGWFK